MDKIIVTGANGFIGSHVVNFLITNTDSAVIAIDTDLVIRSEYISAHSRIKYIALEDFISDMDIWKDVSCIFHIGAISSTTERDWAKINFYNIYFSKCIIQFAVEHDIHLLFTSSASLYGHELTFNIDNAGKVYSLYAYSKLVTDRYLRNLFSSGASAKLTCLRLFNVYGKNEKHKKDQASPFYKFEQQAIEKKNICLFENSGDFLRDFIDVEDVVSLLYKVYTEKIYGTYNIGTGAARSFQYVAEKIAEKNRAEIEWIEMPQNLKTHYQVYTKADHEDLLQKIGGYTFRTF